MKQLGVFLAGEGKNELGGWAAEPAYRRLDEPGVLEALLRRARAEGWAIRAGRVWKDARKYTVGRPMDPETRTVLAFALDATEAGCDVLAFTRDEDGDRSRTAAIERGLTEARERQPALAIVGGTARPTLEGWILAVMGVAKTEEMSRAKAARKLSERGVPEKDTRAMVERVMSCDPDKRAPDAKSLARWLDSARDALAPER